METMQEIDPNAQPQLLSSWHAEFNGASDPRCGPPAPPDARVPCPPPTLPIPLPSADPARGPTPDTSNFLKGVKWSPDGVCLLAAAEDSSLRVFDLPGAAVAGSDPPDPGEPPAPPALRLPAGELIYDFCWFPWASAASPDSFCFAVTTRAHPIHLYDGISGRLRASYRPYNDLDELAPSYSVGFAPDGATLIAGGRAAIHFFDVERPGRDHATLATHRRGEAGQPGLISCLACARDGSGLLAAGSYAGTAGLYDHRTREQLAVLEGHTGGVTHLDFSACATYLYSGARRDGAVYCWDARQMSGAVYVLRRAVESTNQRIYFDVEGCGRHLASGGEDGRVALWDLRDGTAVGGWQAAGDTVNGCQFHPVLPLLTTASGQRRFAAAEALEREEEGDEGGGEEGFRLGEDENCVRVWRLGQRPLSGGGDLGDAEMDSAALPS